MKRHHVDITPEFLGELGECCYKQYSYLRGWAWTSTEKIYKKPIHNDRLEFAYGFERILVKIPYEIQQEIHEISRPSNRDEASPSFTYMIILPAKPMKVKIQEFWMN